MVRLILLRHEKRENYPGFFSNLTNDGLKDAFKLSKKIDSLHIDIIYCSPFIRTLQTIYPYCFKYDKKINIEYALHEYKHNPYFLLEPNIYNIEDINNPYLESIIKKEYKSIVQTNDFNYIFLEDEPYLKNRIQKFLNHLKKNNKYKNKNILLVTHKGVINQIKKIINKNTNMDDDFQMGSYEIINY
jgi:broad specificity phosphatase PhoE